MRAVAESSRTSALVGSLGQPTLFARRSPYSHPKSPVSSQVFDLAPPPHSLTRDTRGEAPRRSSAPSDAAKRRQMRRGGCD